MDYFKKINKLNEGILNEIRDVLVKNGGTITIPYFYDEDMIDDEDITQLIEDGYDVRVGELLDNVFITADTWGEEVEVVAVTLGWQWDSNAVVVVDKTQAQFSLTIQDNPYALAFLLEKINEVVEKSVEC
jgi:hypothetical protein